MQSNLGMYLVSRQMNQLDILSLFHSNFTSIAVGTKKQRYGYVVCAYGREPADCLFETLTERTGLRQAEILLVRGRRGK